MSNSRYKICSDACLLLGASPINSFDDGTVESEVCASVYDDLYDNLLAHRDWTFARDYIKPNLLNKESILGYKYVYHKPANVISILQDYKATEYKIVGYNEIHTNEKDLILFAKVKPDEAVLPADFVLALKYLIAAEVAIPVTEDGSRAQYFEQKAPLQIARAIDNDLTQEPDTTYFSNEELNHWYN